MTPTRATPQHNQHWERFGVQTRHKHFVLEAYLKRWASILLQRHSRLWFIDAFAGRGRDEQGTAGSPIIACEVAELLRQDRGLEPGAGVQVICIEDNPPNFRHLEQSLADRRDQPYLTLHSGTLEEHAESVFGAVGDRPALFFLDPFGLKGLTAGIVQRALRGSHREVLLLFSDEGASRLGGVSRATPTERRAEESLDLFAETRQQEPVNVRQATAFATSPAAAEEILRTAFGEPWEPIAEIHRRGNRREILRAYQDRVRSWGAEYVQPVSIADEAGAHCYYLVHASAHPAAIIAFKDAVHSAMKRRQEEPGGTTSLFFESAADVAAAAREIALHFSGGRVTWGSGDRTTGTVRGYAMIQTELLLSDMKALKGELARYQVQIAGSKAICYQFP